MDSGQINAIENPETNSRADDVQDKKIRYGNNKAHRTKSQRKIQAAMVKKSRRRNRR